MYHLDELFGPATGKTFNGEPFATGHNVTDIKEGIKENSAGADAISIDAH